MAACQAPRSSLNLGEAPAHAKGPNWALVRPASCAIVRAALKPSGGAGRFPRVSGGFRKGVLR
eukprot:12293708-Alexandrium_andersonii.AAC.1